MVPNHAKLPVGQYELVVAKGPEYRFIRRNFTVESDRTQAIRVDLKRWDNLPAKGWYSGDNHIHYIRHDKNDDLGLLLFTQAEDLRVANILQMGNVATAVWPDYGWSPAPFVNTMRLTLSRRERLTLLNAAGRKGLGLAVVSSAFVALVLASAAHGHWVANVPEQVMDWQTDQISRAVAWGSDREVGQIVGLDGKKCLEGSSFSFDVDDRYAFDIDETVQMEVEFYRHLKAAAVEVSYEKNGQADAKLKGQIPAYKDGERTYKAAFSPSVRDSPVAESCSLISQ